mmetsp:Transcript_9452/g.17947  ORF Transcript_9452/g.17947 Transcript_9452/m.17947 type:complete len:432 (+) Transcript_9452:28-1323(+)
MAKGAGKWQANNRKGVSTKLGKQGTRPLRHQRSGDPSMAYIVDPLSAPTVLWAQRFFKKVLPHGQESMPIHLGPKEGWRTEAKLAVRSGPDGKPLIGLFAPGTHDVVSLNDCPAHHPAINAALRLVGKTCAEAAIRGFDEARNEGDLRYLKLDVHRRTELVQLTLVWHAASAAEAGVPLRRLVKRLLRAASWHSIWANFHPAVKHVSRILSHEQESWQRLAGCRRVLHERLKTCSLPYKHPVLCFPPYVFRQANLTAFEAIVSSLRRFVPQGSRVVELYGGVGTIGLHLADLVSSLACSDENPHNKRCFEFTAARLPEELQQRLDYKSGDAASQAPTIAGADIVIVDPPRKGLDEEVVGALLQRGARGQCGRDRGADGPWRLLYVSCGFKALQRDIERLLAGGWSLKHVEGFVLFPGADHIETFCVLERCR